MARRVLDITGGGERVIPYWITTWEAAPLHGVVMLPGLGYTCDMPAFYYLEEMALDLGAAVLRLAPAYNEDERFTRWPLDDQQRDWLRDDIDASLTALLAVHDVPRLTIIAKSLTTIGLAAADWSKLAGPDRTVRLVWLTPVLRDAVVVDRLGTTDVPSLVAIGSADHHFDQAVIDRLSTLPHVTFNLIDGADHSFDQRGDIQRSLGNILQVVEGVRAFAFAD